jgi:hypothetical protein
MCVPARGARVRILSTRLVYACDAVVRERLHDLLVDVAHLLETAELLAEMPLLEPLEGGVGLEPLVLLVELHEGEARVVHRARQVAVHGALEQGDQRRVLGE